MKKQLIAIAALSVLGMTAAHAAATVGATGTITFQGQVNTDSCVLSSNSSGTSANGGNIVVNMGSVSSLTLGSEALPGSSAGGIGSVLAQPLDLRLQCAASTAVSLKLTRQVASGKGIGLAPGGAGNVQIMLVDDNTNTPLDFTSGSVTLSKNLTTDGKTGFPLRAYYTLVNGKKVTDVVPGVANATVNYEITYN